MSGPWENYQAGPWTQYQTRKPEPKEESGVLRQAADIPLSLGRGALSGVRMIADAFGAGSGISESIKGAEGYLAGLMSAQARNDEQEIARIMKDAEDKGALEQVKAGLKAFSVAPVDLLTQGLGTAAPAILGLLGSKVLGAGALGARAVSAGIGAAMGAGTTKGAIYEETKKTLVDAGLDERQAEERAQQAQAYGGQNLDQILLGTGLGAFASATGLESSVRNILTRAGAKEVAKERAEEVAKRGIMQTARARAGEAAAEAAPEFIQAGQEQMARNIAQQREGFDVPTMRGVVGAGTLEGLAGAGLGAGFGAADAGLRSQAQAEAARILEQEERLKAEAARVAQEESMRTLLEAQSRVPAEEPVGPSITRTGRASLLGGEDPLAAAMRARREEQEAAAQVPLGEDYAFLQREKQRLMAAEQTPEVRAELKRVNDQIQSILVRDLEWRPGGPEAVRASVFGEAELPTPITREQLMAPKVEPFAPATTTPRASLLGAAPAGGGIADVLTARREAEAAKAEVPLSQDYAFLTREKTRLSALPKTPETTAAIQRIDQEIARLDAQAIERRRRDAEAAKTSVFAQEKLPPVESRADVVGREELAKAQAREAQPEVPLTKKEVTSVEKMRGQPAPAETEADQKIAKLEAQRKSIKSPSLYGALIGKLNPSEVRDISPDIGNNLRKKGGGGTFISDLVASGTLDEYLPPNMRPGSITFDEQEATEFIKDKLRNKDSLSFDASMQARQLDEQINQLRKETEGPRRAEYEISEVEPGEAASIERSAGDAEILENLRYQRATTEGKSIGKDQTQAVVDAVKSMWKNAPEVVVAENMDDPAIPAEVREHNKAAMAKGAKGSPRGFFYKGKAYILANAATSNTQVIETLFHEALGHYGLRGTFGPEMEAVLKDVVKNRRADVEAKAKQYGLDPNKESDMLEAAEEVLAEIAQTKPGLSFVKRAIAAIRNFLRDLGLPFKMSNEDIIQKYILPARDFVEKGGSKAVEGKPAAMRGQKPSEAFKRWFGRSILTDDSGNPMVMYHQTKSDFSEFIPGGMNEKVSGPAIWVRPDPSKMMSGHQTGTRRPGKFQEGTVDMPLYVKLENALGSTDKNWKEVYGQFKEKGNSPWIMTPEFVKELKSKGYDGIMHMDSDGNMQEVAVFDPKQVKSAIGNIGTFDPKTADIRYQREEEPEGRTKEPKRNILGNPVLGSWTSPTDTKLAGTKFNQDDLIYSLQDKQIDIKRVVQNITNTAGRIAAKWNPYLQEELYHGRTARATKEFLQDELRPLIQEIQKNGMTIEELEKYLHNRHAEAYNNHVAKVNPNNPKMQDGGSGIKTEDARKYLASIPADKRKVYEDLAKKVDAITKGTRKLVVESGLEGYDTIAAWEKAFPDYVPLMREESDDFDYTTPAFGVGSGYDVRGKFSRAAMGSERNVANILANIAMQREKAIIKSNKNRVAQAVFGLAVQNPNPDFWLAVNPAAEEVPAIALDELRAMGIDESAINFLMQEPKQRAVDPKRNEVVNRINATLRKSDNVLAMRINGEDRYVFFNQNDPRAKRAAEALKNLDADKIEGILKPISVVTRWMASVNTQYNPIFGAYNFLRDVQGAALQLSTTPIRGKQKEVMAGVLPSLKGIYSAVRAEREGKKVDTELGRLWNEFQEEGGQTGFRDMYSRAQDRKEALEKELKQITEGKAKAAGRAIFDWLSDYNDSMENAVRLSAYKVAKEKFIKDGMSEEEAKQEAASVAKNLTVNFNRKGQIATQAGALYAFFNAAIQGTTRLAQTLSGPAGRKIIAGGLLLGAMQAALLAAAGFDDEEPPEFVRERNIIIPTGKDTYFAFPMPLGYHVIPGFSRILSEWALSGFKNTPERIASLTGMFLEAFNPIGNAGWSVQTLAPTFADPIVALSENKDWTGKPIARKDFSNMDPTPGYTRAKDTATMFSTQLAKFINYASGGTEFRPGVLSPTPDQIDYLIGQAFGGLGREATKLEQTVVKTATGEELPPYKIPLVGRFYGETKSSAAESNRFYKNMTLLNEHENEIKGRRQSGQPTSEYIKDNPEARLAPLARKTYTNIQKLRKRKEQLVEKGAPRESVKAVEEQIRRTMETFNSRVEALKD